MHIEEYREHWEVRAYLGPLNRIRIGSSNDDVEASIVAARLSEFVNVRVIPWTEAKVVNVEIEL